MMALVLLAIEGCLDETSINYNPLANVDSGSCIESVFGCMNINAF